MANDKTRTINQLVDQLEGGKLTVRAFLRKVQETGPLPSGIGPSVHKAPTIPPLFVRTRVVVRISAMEGAAGTLIEGTVKAGGPEFGQVITNGAWRLEMTEGVGDMQVQRTKKRLRKGERIEVPRNRSFRFLTAKRSWRFRAQHPTWQPNTFFYRYQGRRIPGSEMWFEIKTSPDDDTQRPLYNVLPADQKGTFVVVTIEPGTRTIRQYYTDGANIVTAISGNGILSISSGSRNGRRARRVLLDRGTSVKIDRLQRFEVINEGTAPLFVEVRPDKPRMWDPARSFWQVSSRRFVSGNDIYFEHVIPR